jgi:hypothetical protein
MDIMKAKQDTRPMKGCWAPGNYYNNCIDCGYTFVGDKRASKCADCAYVEEEEEGYLAEVVRFKPSGKFYDSFGFKTSSEWMFEIREGLEESGKIEGYYTYLLTGKVYSVEGSMSGKDIPNGYPTLIKL